MFEDCFHYSNGKKREKKKPQTPDFLSVTQGQEADLEQNDCKPSQR